jgi:hypothetical protein
MMLEHQYRDALKRLMGKTQADQYKLIWQWSKEGRLNLKQFKELIAVATAPRERRVIQTFFLKIDGAPACCAKEIKNPIGYTASNDPRAGRFRLITCEYFVRSMALDAVADLKAAFPDKVIEMNEGKCPAEGHKREEAI